MASAIATTAFGVHEKLFVDVTGYIYGLIVKFAVFAPQTLTFARFLALTYPFFQERMVAKKTDIFPVMATIFSNRNDIFDFW